MDLSFVELFFVAIIALLVLGPEEMVKKSQKMGEFFGSMKSRANNLKHLVQSELEIKNLQEEANKLDPDTTKAGDDEKR